MCSCRQNTCLGEGKTLMANVLTYKEVLNQSNAVFNQFGLSKWIPYAKFNKHLFTGNSQKFYHSGLGKFLVCVAMGESLEQALPVLKQYRDRVDIVCCDKSFSVLMDNGIKPNFVILCDCNIPFKYIEKYIDQTEGVTLFATPYANPKWLYHWKGEKYYFINQDAIKSEKHFLNILGSDARIVPAGSNVSNAMITFFAGCNNESNENWSGYEKFLLIGYDYSWRPDGNYYAFINPKPKRFYMNRRTMLDMNGDMVHTSENLFFSAKWLYTYITTFKIPAVNCSMRGLLDLPYKNILEAELKAISTNPRARLKYNIAYNAMVNAHRNINDANNLYNLTREDLYDNRK